MANERLTPETSGTERTVISVDAMGGDKGPVAVVAGLVDSVARNPDLHVLLHGDEAQLAPLLAREPALTGRVTLRHADRVVTMDDKPSQVMRHGQGTSMWATIDAVRDGEAGAAVSCGNTGALMAVSMLRLRKLPGVNRPAIACLWPSRSPGGFNVMLDVGADVKAEASDLLQYAIMGASYARNGLSLERPRVGLLNVGTEEHKGRAELKEALELLARNAEAGGYESVGFVEGLDIPSDRVDVIVTDGFTGNVALKTGEGTAKLISELLREAFGAGILSKFAALLALNSLKRLQKRIDPRRVNGGVFLGLNGTVVKSHGGADATGVSAAVGLAYRLARAGFLERLAARVASAEAAGQDASPVETGAAKPAGSNPEE
ncbi:phosphate acyltransferase PlsX [Fuscovulum blasticum]|uniref:phosphate acyltransferase PlsX n=1 Tax=Fuscovulum blasticum TaxID=1075 RepID=UPI000D3EAFB0|nr:phosphate acyltransferase PlsX [Fuscovulum blasticum]AWD20455.1 phosphate acyltransferase [Fuscovulum blasticum]